MLFCSFHDKIQAFLKNTKSFSFGSFGHTTHTMVLTPSPVFSPPIIPYNALCFLSAHIHSTLFSSIRIHHLFLIGGISMPLKPQQFSLGMSLIQYKHVAKLIYVYHCESIKDINMLKRQPMTTMGSQSVWYLNSSVTLLTSDLTFNTYNIKNISVQLVIKTEVQALQG